MSGPLLPSKDQAEVQAVPGLILEPVLWLVVASLSGQGSGPFSTRPSFSSPCTLGE